MPILDDTQIASFFALEEVQAAKRQIDANGPGSASVHFTIAMTETIKSILKESFGLELPSTIIPMRWIKGDVAPHVDVGKATFDTTHLMYLTDSPGELMLGGIPHPITKGTAYTFPESVRHETINTGSEPRLLLGPMSEDGFAVGLPPSNTIAGDGGSIVYIHQVEGANEYSFDQINWFLFAMPTTITNTDTGSGVFTVEFTTDISFDASDNYFICGSSHIQFGSTSLKGDGTRPVITINGVEGYPGLIQNGTDVSGGYSDIFIFNLFVDVSGSTLADGGGWIGQAYFGNAATNNFIVNCSSSGPISIDGGGIVGRRGGAGTDASLTLIGCSSSGEISLNAGGIAGRYAGNNSGSIRCESCWSTGYIGESGGGITGDDTQNATIENCYSTGATIDEDGGGICGEDCENSTITNCYSTGSISSDAGGIVGKSSDTVTITNCYSVGSIESGAGGILGNDSNSCIITNCYTVGAVTDDLGYIIGDSDVIPATCFSEAFTNAPGGSWNAVNTIDILLGRPNPIVGEFWVDVSSGSPYELGIMGYTPYTVNNIEIVEGDPVLNRGIESSVAAGSATAGAIVAGKAYRLLDISEGDTGSYSSISIDPTSGIISTTAATVPGYYVIFLRNNGSYNITGYGLTVTAPIPSDSVPCCARPTFRRGPLIDNATLTALAAGNTYIGSVRRAGTNIPYAQLMAMKKAKASK
jgi:hypothetical protein